MTWAEILLPTIDRLPPLTGATQWLNSPPLTPEQLRGRVVLVNFWTYTCVNWLRTLPYLRAWDAKYRDRGLVLLGVHTPEFALEHNIDNVQQALRRFGITYPVTVDNQYAVWQAFSNYSWPALYFVDATGRIRHHHSGEGEYEMSERLIQQLLMEAGGSDLGEGLVSVEPQGVEVPAAWEDVQSPETYLGYERGSGFATAGEIVTGRRHSYDPAASLRLNQWTLAGGWTVDEGAAVSHDAPAKVRFRFHARDVNLVMGPVMHGATIPVRVRLDGEPPRDAHGADVDEHGYGMVDEQRLYQLIRQPKPIADRTVEIEFLEPGAQVLAFTFG